MNLREKILVGFVAVMFVLFGGKAVRNGYLGKLETLDRQITKLKKDLVDIEFQKSKTVAGLKPWGEAGRQTLSMEPNDAWTKLREELNALTDRVGMPAAEVKQKGKVTAIKKSGLRVLSCDVESEDVRLNEIVSFLYELSSQPYLVRCNELEITHPSGRGHKKDKGNEKDKLKMTAHLDTLILPPLELESGKLRDVVTTDLRPGKRKVVMRTKLASLKNYSDIVNRKLFQPYIPPAPAKAASPNPRDRSRDVTESNLVLRWKKGAQSQNFKVFIGEKRPGQPDQPQHEAPLPEFRPAKLAQGKTYYWRVDSIGEGGTTVGDVWMFTTKAPPRQTPPTPVAEKEPPKPTGPPPCQPKDGDLVLGRVLSSPRTLQIVLEDRKRREAGEDVRKELGEEIFCGKLILIHPKGAVSERDGQRRFHPVGEPLKACKPLTPEDFPQVFHELAKLEELARGISKRSG